MCACWLAKGKEKREKKKKNQQKSVGTREKQFEFQSQVAQKVAITFIGPSNR